MQYAQTNCNIITYATYKFYTNYICYIKLHMLHKITYAIYKLHTSMLNENYIQITYATHRLIMN